GMDQPWQNLLPLPAPQTSNIQEGVAGAFSGKTNGVTVVAGGANFHGAKQAFESGKMFAHEGLSKAFNDDIYVEKDGIWSTVNPLPEGLAYGASFTTSEGVLIVGGEKSSKEISYKVYMLVWNGSNAEVID
ncbi:N-acetylneuraminic acid mutarotase, partial [Vibrio anguillarum]|nr:N-acetylneuraminic acid mutarotase [Vibrio anguillarum]